MATVAAVAEATDVTTEATVVEMTAEDTTPEGIIGYLRLLNFRIP